MINPGNALVLPATDKVCHVRTYETLEQLQHALAELLPLANAAKHPPSWILLHPNDGTRGDPLPQPGYIGFKVKL